MNNQPITVFDPEQEERHRKKNEENRKLLAEKLAQLKAGKITLDDLNTDSKAS